MSFDIDEYYNNLSVGNVLLAYKGNITSDLISTALELIEVRLDSLNESLKLRKKVYNVLVEILQNLFHHVEDLPPELEISCNSKFGIIVVTRLENNKYKITTGNFINSSKIKLLKDKIDKINASSAEELKEMYKFILNHQKLTAKGGGGLGLVDIARKTESKLEYSFENYNNNCYFFNLEVIIS